MKFDSVFFEQSRSTVSRKQIECILGEAVIGVAMGKFFADLTLKNYYAHKHNHSW
jgi:hypothetical protein